MFIDSPEFVRRKILVAQNNILDYAQSNKSSPNTKTANKYTYEYGSERVMLAKHVGDQLNGHQNDELILERFRKEAQELKMQKWKKRFGHSKP
jgi:hypothetical protein